MSYYQPQSHAQNASIKSLIWNLGYVYKDDVERMCAELILHTSVNKASTEAYVHTNGAKQTLLKITGLLPITYNTATYNIPVCFWLPYQFPDRPPMCYVVPTSSMEIKAKHKHVNKQGYVFHQYLSAWSRYQSNLIALTTNLQSVFGKEPPVFAKQPQAAKPASYGRVEQPPSYHNAFNAYNRSMNQAQPGARALPFGQPVARPQPAYVKPPSYPGQPGAAMQPGAASYGQPPPPSYNEIPKVNQQPPSYDQVGAIARKPEQVSASKKEQLTQKVKKKLEAELMRFHKDWVKEVNELQRLQSDLATSKAKIEKEQNGIESEANDLKKLKEELEGANATLQSWLDANKDSPPVDLLKTVEPQDVWTKQLIKAVAQDSAIDDTLYCLDRALGEDTIVFKKYLKQVRKLTREQFFSRALAQKICNKQREFKERSEKSPHWQPWNNVLS